MDNEFHCGSDTGFPSIPTTVVNTLSSGLTPRGLGTRLLVSLAIKKKGENLILIWPAMPSYGSILRGLGSNTYRWTVYILIHATQV